MLGLGIGLFQNVAAASSGGATATTWDPAHSTDWTLSNTNKTALRTANTSFWGLVWGTAAKTNGTYTATLDVLDGGLHDAYISLHTDNTFTGNQPGADALGKGISYQRSGGGVAFNGGAVAYGTGNVPSVATDVISWQVDHTNSQFVLKRNGTTLGTFTFAALTTIFGSAPPITTSAVYPVLANGNATGTQVTANFTAF